MLYIFHGPDDFTRNEQVTTLREAMGDPTIADLNVTVLEGRDLTLSEIRQHADAMPFMANKRVVIATGFISQLNTKSDEVTDLIDYLGQLSPTTDLVLVERESLRINNPVIKAAASLEGATVTQFAGPDKKNLRPWIINKAQQHEATIEPAAADLLGRLTGPELQVLDNELEKLALYVGSERPIKREDVDLLVPYTEDAENFGLAKAIGQRNARRAYDQLRKQLDEGKHPMVILASIATQIRGLLEVKDMAARGMSPLEITNSKGWSSDYAARMRLKEATRFSMARLENILEQLLQIDLDIKTGQTDSLLALDTLIARLCALASK